MSDKTPPPDAAEGEERWDESPGDVIDAKPDGTIVLDDGITTYNPRRACEFFLARATAAEEERDAAEASADNWVEQVGAVMAERDTACEAMHRYRRRATAAEDRADASETRERVTHERAEQAESQLAHYKAEVERLREALADLASWQPETEQGLAALHPQHRAAVERARSALTPPPAGEDESA